jgi:hypothetical protein
VYVLEYKHKILYSGSGLYLSRKKKITAPDTFISGGVTHVRLVEEQILINLVGNLPN